MTGSRTWDDMAGMRRAFNRAWVAWGPASVSKPVLVSGHCPRGADAMAERLWGPRGCFLRFFDLSPRAPASVGLTHTVVSMIALNAARCP